MTVLDTDTSSLLFASHACSSGLVALSAKNGTFSLTPSGRFSGQ